MILSIQRALVGFIGYGVGFLIGFGWLMLEQNFPIVTNIFQVLPSNSYTALLSTSLIASFAAGIGGAIGGLILGYFSAAPRRPYWSFILQSAISVAVPAGLLLYPVFFAFPLMQMSGAESISIFAIIGLMIGAVFGFVQGLIYWLLRSRRFQQIVNILASTLAFAVGGIAIGAIFWQWMSTSSITFGKVPTALLIWIALSVFFFGASGGFALGLTHDQKLIKEGQN